MRAVPLANSQPVRAYLTMICIRLDSHGRSLVARDGFAVPPMGLTNREIERLRLVASGHADKEIAQGRGVEPSTAKESKAASAADIARRTHRDCGGLGIVDG